MVPIKIQLVRGWKNVQLDNEDAERIIGLFEDRGYDITRQQADMLWGSYSQRFFRVSFVSLPVTDKRVFEVLEEFFVEV